MLTDFSSAPNCFLRELRYACAKRIISPHHCRDFPLMPQQRKRLYEGKTKILYKGPQPGTLVQHFKDDATAFNRQKHAKMEGKGVLNKRISEALFLRLQEMGVRTHFMKSLNMREQLIREAEVIALEVVVRNAAAGSLVKRLGLKEGQSLPVPLVEYYYKDDQLGDPLVSEGHILTFQWSNPREMEYLETTALRINDYLTGLFHGLGLRLIDLKLEFGRYWDNDEEQILLVDEISPDSCRLWDTRSGKKMDKDRFRQDLGGLMEAYEDVARRLDVLPARAPKSGGQTPRLVRAK